MSNEGKLLARLGGEDGPGLEIGKFMAPHGLAVDSRGDIYVGEVAYTNWLTAMEIRQDQTILERSEAGESYLSFSSRGSTSLPKRSTCSKRRSYGPTRSTMICLTPTS